MTDNVLTDNTPAACRLLLATLLAEGPMPAVEMFEQLAEMGYSVGQIKRAKKALGIPSSPARAGHRTLWSLPTDCCATCGRPWPEGTPGDAEPSSETAPSQPPPDPGPAPTPPRGPAADATVSTCIACGRAAMLPPGSPCIGLGCRGVLQ